LPYLFNDSFDSNNFSLWSGILNSTGGSESIQATTPYGGSNVAKFTLDGSTRAYAHITKDLGSSYSSMYLSGFVCLDALLSSDNYLNAGITLDSINGTDLSSAYIHNNAGQFLWCLKYWNSTSHDYNYVDSYLGSNISVGTWYYLEVMCKVGAGNGEVALWVNNTQVCDVVGLTNNGDGALQLLKVGPYSPFPGTLVLNDYIDGIVASTSFISEPTLTPAITFTTSNYIR